MQQFFRLGLAVFLGIVLLASIDAQAQKKMKKEATVWPAEDLKWDSLKGAPPGVMSAVLWGNTEKGPFGILTKFPAGFKAPLHHHTSDLKLIVIKGAYIYVSADGTEKRCGPGSYVFEPSGDRHATRGAEDSETIFYIEGNHKFDIVPEKMSMDTMK